MLCIYDFVLVFSATLKQKNFFIYIFGNFCHKIKSDLCFIFCSWSRHESLKWRIKMNPLCSPRGWVTTEKTVKWSQVTGIKACFFLHFKSKNLVTFVSEVSVWCLDKMVVECRCHCYIIIMTITISKSQMWCFIPLNPQYTVVCDVFKLLHDNFLLMKITSLFT